MTSRTFFVCLMYPVSCRGVVEGAPSLQAMTCMLAMRWCVLVVAARVRAIGSIAIDVPTALKRINMDTFICDMVFCDRQPTRLKSPEAFTNGV